MLQIWFRLVVKNVSGQARRIMKSLVSLALVVGVPNLLDQNEDCSFIRIFPLSLNYEVKSCFSSRYSLVTALFQLSTPSQPCLKQASNKHEHLTKREGKRVSNGWFIFKHKILQQLASPRICIKVKARCCLASFKGKKSTEEQHLILSFRSSYWNLKTSESLVG